MHRTTMAQRASMTSIEVGGIKRDLMSKPVQWWENVSCTPAAKFWRATFASCNKKSPLSCSIRNFGPKIVPILQVGQRGLVNFESGFQANIATINDYQRTCSPQTWETMKTYAHSLKRKGVKIAFFSSAYQDDEVALMRQSLVRLAHLLGINLKWFVNYSEKTSNSSKVLIRYVPKPRPSVIRIARKMHNILQVCVNCCLDVLCLIFFRVFASPMRKVVYRKIKLWESGLKRMQLGTG